MPSNPESFNKDNAGESAGETSRATFAERGRKVYEVVISEMSSREILDMIDNGEFDAVENETAEQKTARLEKAREARAKLIEERERLYGKRSVEAPATETSTVEAPAGAQVESSPETQTESPAEAPVEIEEAVAAQEEAPTSVSAEEIATDIAGAAVASAAIETAATDEAEKIATAEKEKLADAELGAKLDEVEAAVAASSASPEATDETAEQIANQPEVISEAEARQTLKKAEENPTFRDRALKIFLALATVATLIPAGVAGIMHGANHDSNLQQTQSEQVEKGNVDESQEASIGESQEAEIGIKDGYGEYGMFLSENKGTPNDFASAAEVAEICTVDNKIDETEMVIYTADNQVESMADYIANLPEELQPEGFKGLTILETEQKLQSLSDEEYEKVQQQFNDIMDEAFVRDVTLDGDYQNAYMRLIDPSKPATHDNMELVACTTHEQGITVKEFVWYEGNNAHNPVIGSMIVKIIQNEDGSISGCMQVVNQVGSPVYDGMTPFTPDQPDPGTGSEGTGSEGTGSEGTGSEGTGSEGTGSEGTGSEDTGSEGTGSEGTDIQAKNYEEMERIDNQILDDIADDIGTDKVTVEQTSTAEVESQPVTEQPSGEDYQGTEPTIVQNETVQQAEPIQEQVSEVNNTSEDLGRANPLPENAVQENQQAQSQADARGDTAASQSQIASELGDILN